MPDQDTRWTALAALVVPPGTEVVVFRVPRGWDYLAVEDMTTAVQTALEGIGVRALVVERGVEVDTLDAAFIETLAARVHAAWMAEKQRHGYADHPFARKMTERDACQHCADGRERHQAAMVPFADLEMATKEERCAWVRAVLTALVEGEAPS